VGDNPPYIERVFLFSKGVLFLGGLGFQLGLGSSSHSNISLGKVGLPLYTFSIWVGLNSGPKPFYMEA